MDEPKENIWQIVVGMSEDLKAHENKRLLVIHGNTWCLQKQASKIPGFFKDFQEFLNSFPGFVCTKCLHQISLFIVHTIIIWNIQFHLAYFYLTSLLTLTEADIYWARSLLPEILLTVQIMSTQLQILSTQSTKYRQKTGGKSQITSVQQAFLHF